MISLVTNDVGIELGYLFDDLFIPNNTLRLVTLDRINYAQIKKGRVEDVAIIVSENAYPILTIDYTKEHSKLFTVKLDQNDVDTKRYIYIGITQIPKNDLIHPFWRTLTFPYLYQIYDTKLMKIVGYMITSSDIYSPSENNIHICMIEMTDKGQGIGKNVIRDLLTFKPIRGMATQDNKNFWTSLGANYLQDGLHFNIN